jgi:hypothetical protein
MLLVITHNGNPIRIPDKEIENNMRFLELSQEEAVQVWLDDNGYTTNAEQESLTAKAKENRTTLPKAQKEKAPNAPKRKTRTVAANPEKQEIINVIFAALQPAFPNVAIVNKEKTITLTIGTNEYKVDLIQHRNKK